MGESFIAFMLVILLDIFQTGGALKCWHCSSDVDPLCHDNFNVTEIFRREGRDYVPYQTPQYDQAGRYNSRYDPYNQNYQGYNRPPYNSQQSRTNNGPRLEDCNDEEARIRGKKNVCLKKVQKLSSSSLSVIRRCDMIPFDKDISTCYDPVNRGVTLEFCEYCDYDGCNSAMNIEVNYLLINLVSVVIYWLYHQ